MPSGSGPAKAGARPNPAHRGAMQQYQRAQVETASPTRLVVLLYEGAIRFCRMAQDAMKQRDLETQNTNLIRAQRIVTELLSSLDRNAGGEVASNLGRIYTHLFEELVKANLYDRPEALDHAIAMLTDMRATWVEIDRMAATEGRPGEWLRDAVPPDNPEDPPGPTAPSRPQPSRNALAPRPPRSRLGDRLA
jgi:flagellar protein FliS